MSYSARNGRTKFRRETLVSGDSGGSVAISSQFHIDHTYESHQTQRVLWNSLMTAAELTLLYQLFFLVCL